MPLKNDWQNGDTFTPAAANDMANSVNAATNVTVDGASVSNYELDPTPLTASDVGAYSRAEVDDAIEAAKNGPELINPKVVDSSGGNVARYGSVANGVNYLTFNNSATGASPSISATASADTNASILAIPKGSGRLTVYVDTGQTPIISGSGVDANHNLNLVSKGTGVVQINGNAALYSGGALGTPSGGTLSGCSGLPVSGITSSTSTALGVGSLELGHASDTTLTKSASGVLAVEGFDVTTTSVVSVTGASTLSAVGNRHYIILLGSGAVATLPTAVGNTSLYHLKNVHTASLTVAVTSSQTIDGGTGSLTILAKQSYTLVSDGSNWVII
jgi:hypothetical protein